MRRVVVAVVLALALILSSPILASGKGKPVRPQYFQFSSVLFGLDNPARDTDAAVAVGLNGIRITNFLDESSSGNPYDSARWTKVDTLISAAKSRGLKVILDLSTYRNQLLAKGINPYTLDWGTFLSFVGNRYVTESAIASYSLAGEPEPPNGSNPARPTTQDLTNFYARSIIQLRSIVNKPVASGGLLQLDWNSGIDWQAIARVSDIVEVHIYGSGDESMAPTVAQYAKSIGKPFYIEEFGFTQQIGDSQRATNYTRIYNLATNNDAAGVGFWNLGPEIASGSHDVNVNTPLTWGVIHDR